jgi:hypothetical protein
MNADETQRSRRPHPKDQNARAIAKSRKNENAKTHRQTLTRSFAISLFRVFAIL